MNDKGSFRPIWEMELIISGAIIIGLFQLPAMVDQAYYRIEPHISFTAFWLPFLFYYLTKLALNLLIGSFLIHFIIRSIWVAVLGLQAVFPEKVDVEKLDVGLIQKAYFRKKNVNLDDFRTKLDHIASLIFTVQFLFIGVLVFLAFLIAFSGFLGWIVSFLGLSAKYSNLFLWIFGIIYGIYALLASVNGILDSWFTKDEDRVKKYPRLYRFARFCFATMYHLSLAFIARPVLLTLRMHATGKLLSGGGFALMVAVFIPFFVGVMLKTSEFDSYIYMPVNSSPQLLQTACYDNLRTSSDNVDFPSIQSDIIEADSSPIKLFLPFLVTRNNQLLRELCPEIKNFHKEGLYRPQKTYDLDFELHEKQIMEALDCTKQLYQIRLDGQPVNTDDIMFAHHPQSRKGGLLLYIPTGDLTAGKHVIGVTMKKQRKKEVEDVRIFIPFWLQK